MSLNPLRYLKYVKLTTHACKRFWEYTEEIEEVRYKNYSVNKIRKLVARRLGEEIRRGLLVDNTGAIHIPIKYGLYAAILLPKDVYLVVTFHKNKKGIDIEKLREKNK